MQRVRPQDAAAVAVLSAIGLLVLPVMQAAEPDEGLVAPGPADPAWWLAVVLLAAQSVALLWATRAPRLVVAPVVFALAAP